tara:strand:- start:688 stop:2601 length:1914 start_codon:yes stop_codon:yes gene_type:complete
MTSKNFIIKNGLTVGNTEVIDSSGNITASGVGAAVQEAIADKIGGIIQGSGSTTVTYDDANDTITISSTGKTEEEIQDIVGTQIVSNGSHTGVSFVYDDSTDGGINATVSLSSFNTGNLDEGSNLYYTDARADARIAAASTSDLSEGSNLYYTDERVDDRVNTLITAGSNITTTYDDAAGTLTIAATEDNLSNNDTDDLSEGTTNQYFTEARARSSISVSGDLSYNSTSGVISFTNDAGDIESVTAGDGLSGGGSSGAVSLALDLNELTDQAVDVANDSIAIIDATDNSTKKDLIRDVVTGIAGTGLSSSSGVLNVSLASFDTGNLSEGSNLYYTNERVDDRVNALITAGTNISTSYDDANGTLTINSSGKTEEEIEDIVNGLVVGGTNITSTYDDAAGTLTLAGLSDSDIRGLVSATGDLSYNSGTGVFSFTERTDAQVRGLVSVTDSGGDGSLSYNSSTGVITYTGPSASEVRAHLSAGTGVSYSGGAFSIGQAVNTNSNVTFNNATIDGNLTVNGTTTSVSSTNTTIEDALIELGSGNSGANSNDLGLILERGSTGDNGFMGWDESADRFVVATTTATGSSTGGLSLSEANFRANQITTSYASNSGGVARNIYQSTSAPTSSDGAVGDLWILYS